MPYLQRTKFEGVEQVLKIKVAQNDLKHLLVSEFLKSDEILKIENFCNCSSTTDNQPEGYHSDQLSRSALETA